MSRSLGDRTCKRNKQSYGGVQLCSPPVGFEPGLAVPVIGVEEPKFEHNILKIRHDDQDDLDN